VRTVVAAIGFFVAAFVSVHATAASDHEERAAVVDRARELFLAKDFAELEKTANAYRSEKSRMPSGVWKLTSFYWGIAQALPKQKEDSDFEALFEAAEKAAETWQQRFPQSPTPHIVKSVVLLAHAWAIRGDGYVSTVAPESWKPFKHYLALAADNLVRHKGVASVDPTWYQTMVEIARAQNWERDRLEQLLDEAVDREPLYYQTYFEALYFLTPRWHGSIDDIDALVALAVRRTAQYEGEALYARMYWYASQVEFGSNLFRESLASWPRMKAGFEDLMKRYPDTWNLENYIRFACLARDRETALGLLKRPYARYLPQAWPTPGARVQCERWAFGQINDFP
jgi:hypothetical protein